MKERTVALTGAGSFARYCVGKAKKGGGRVESGMRG